MTKQISNRNLPLLLAQIRESVITHFRPLLNHFGLTEQQWRVLRVLCERTSLEPRDLCETCQILSPSMAGILRRLDEMGHIKRDPIKGDKRRVLISLTPKSKKLIAEMVPLVQEQYQKLEDAWGKELVEQLHETIDALMAVRDVPVEHITLPAKD